ncbi:hypothetical protein NDU88_000261 [Pleurodeles waltl]|uniref:Uncharacterized protein n=1 Tax=Pleurodeles waltl TaxID=8319 RepID=A0AAV7P3G3_PLEWA|nr:hypothetical protein NDU88_000261 [Pleurodeles waltl]
MEKKATLFTTQRYSTFQQKRTRHRLPLPNASSSVTPALCSPGRTMTVSLEGCSSWTLVLKARTNKGNVQTL